jgi:hypothetical protein
MADPIHIQAPDGSIIEFPAGTADSVITSVMAQNYGGPSQPAASPQSAAQPKGTLQSIREAIHAPTRAVENGLFMGLGDRIRAGMGAIIGDGSYSGNLADEQRQSDQFRSDHPIVAPVLEGVGNAAAPLGAIGAASKATSFGGKFLAGAGAGGVIGGAQGALSSRDYTDLPQTAKDAGTGAIIGGGIGGGIPIAGRAIGAGYQSIVNAIMGKPDGISRGASRHLIDAITADTPAAVKSRVAELGPDATLADAGPALLGKAQGASLNSDEGRSVLQSALTARNEGTNQRIMGDVNRALGPAEDPQTVTNAITAHRSAVDIAAYPAALDNAPSVQTAPILRQLEDMIPRSVGSEQKALTNLRDMMMTTERRPLLDAAGHPQYDNLGRQRFTDIPVSQNNADVLHKIKQELDNVIQYDAPGLGVPAGALTRQQGALKNMRGQLNSALEDQVPGYLEANRQSAALARRGQAVDLGTQYLGSGKTTASPERFANEFRQLEPGERIAFAKGSRGEIERQLGTKANDLQALRAALQGEGGWNTAKLATVHGADAADQLIGTVNRNLKFRDTYNKVVENSQTAQRQAAASAMKPVPPGEVPLINPNMSATGFALAGGKKLLNVGLNAVRPDPTRSFGELAKVLSAQGPQRDKHLQDIIDAITRRQRTSAKAPVVGDRAALAAAILGNAYLQNSQPRMR